MKDSKVSWVIGLVCLQLMSTATAQEVAAPVDPVQDDSMSVFDFLGLMLIEDEQMIDPLMLEVFEGEMPDDSENRPVTRMPQQEEKER